MREDIMALQLEALSSFLAFTPRDPSLSLSAQIERDAAAGDIWARRVLMSRILETPRAVAASAIEHVDDIKAVPSPPIAVAAQSAEHRQRVRNSALSIVN